MKKWKPKHSANVFLSLVFQEFTKPSVAVEAKEYKL